jgi:MFS family permease
MLVVTIPAVALADRIPRRTSVIAGGIVLTGCMFTIGSLYASSSVHQGYGFARWVVITAIFLIALTYCFTWAVVAKLYASEIQPAKTRASANSVAQGLSFVRLPYQSLRSIRLLNLLVVPSFLRHHPTSYVPRPKLTPSIPVLQLDRSLRHTTFPRLVLFRRLLHVRLFHANDRRDHDALYARKQRKAAGADS